MSPWTRRQVRLLLSKASPLSAPQQDKMKAELHANPQMGHARKGSKELEKNVGEKNQAYHHYSR